MWLLSHQQISPGVHSRELMPYQSRFISDGIASLPFFEIRYLFMSVHLENFSLCSSIWLLLPHLYILLVLVQIFWIFPQNITTTSPLLLFIFSLLSHFVYFDVIRSNMINLPGCNFVMWIKIWNSTARKQIFFPDKIITMQSKQIIDTLWIPISYLLL